MDKTMNKVKKPEENEVLPIEKQKIKGKLKHILVVLPALNEQWVVEKKFGFYVFPPKKLKNGDYIPGAKDIWLTSTSYVLDDIWWLCELQYHKFWSQIIYDKNALNGIKSFLHLAPLQKLYYKNDDPEIFSMYKQMKKAVLQFLKRISRTKESEIHFISDEKYSQIMNETNLIPLSLLFCVCTIYGSKYRETVKAIVSHLFKYNNNLKLDKVILRTIQLFGSLKKKLKSSQSELKRNVRYSDDDKDILNAINSYRQCILATLQFLANAAINISNFLLIFEEGVELFVMFDFEFHIVRVYKKLLIPIHHEVSVLFSEFCDRRRSQWVNSMIDITRLELIKTFTICLEATLKKLCIVHLSHGAVQRYVKLLKFSLKTEEFLKDLNNFCKIQEITENVKKNCSGYVNLTEIDEINETVLQILNKNENEHADYENKVLTDNDEQKSALHYPSSSQALLDEIFDYVKESYDSEENNVEDVQNSFHEYDTMSDSDLSSDYSDWSDDKNSDSEYECYMAASDEEYEEFQSMDEESCTNYDVISNGHQNGVSEISPKVSDMNLNSDISERTQLLQAELHSAVTHVKDLLPHLGDGFIALCLQHYKMDASAVINAVLEDSLPLSLMDMDFSLSTVPTKIYQEMHDAHQADVTAQNKTEFEGNLKVLRKPEYTTYNEMLNDKTELSDAKSIYEKYRNIEEDDIYNDDVDEDYDEHLVAALEDDPEGFYEKLSVNNSSRRFTPAENISETDSESEKNTSEVRSNFKKPLDFCENPEITRARYDHLRSVADEKRHRRNNHRKIQKKASHENKANSGNSKDEKLKEEQKNADENLHRDDRLHKAERNYKDEKPRKDRRHGNSERNCKEENPHIEDRHYNDERHHRGNRDHNHEKSQREKTSGNNERRRYDEERPQYEPIQDKKGPYNDRRPQNNEIPRGEQNEKRRNENRRRVEERNYEDGTSFKRDRQFNDQGYRNDKRVNTEPTSRYEQGLHKGERQFKDRIFRTAKMPGAEQNRQNENTYREEGAVKGERDHEERSYKSDRQYQGDRCQNENRRFDSKPEYDQRHHKEKTQGNDRRPQNMDVSRRQQSYEDIIPRNENRHLEEDRHHEEEKSRSFSREETRKNVLDERHKKTVYKSRTANHSRKFLSDRKRRF